MSDMLIWHPIETLKPDVDVLLYEGGDIYRGVKRAATDIDFHFEANCGQPVVWTPEPTHWAHLPAPPEGRRNE